MTAWAYIKDKKILYLILAACMAGCFAFLAFCGTPKNQIVLLLFAAVLAAVICSAVDFWHRKRFFDQVEDTLRELDAPYLISEMMPESWRLEDRLYYHILKTSNKSVIDAIHALEKEQKEYREFIENWIHEVKVPLTALYLRCDNEKNENTREMKIQLRTLENDVEKALFYARSEKVYQDYMIREMDLGRAVADAVKKNSLWMIRNRIRICMEDLDGVLVYSDEKWIVFILEQLLINGVKYKKEQDPMIRIRAEREPNGVTLYVWDNGIGIPEGEIPRVFDKGFTGSNGRRREASTGIGLYLCRKLCEKLGISISITSKEGEYTQAALYFPDGSSHFSGNLSKL